MSHRPRLYPWRLPVPHGPSGRAERPYHGLVCNSPRLHHHVLPRRWQRLWLHQHHVRLWPELPTPTHALPRSTPAMPHNCCRQRCGRPPTQPGHAVAQRWRHGAGLLPRMRDPLGASKGPLGAPRGCAPELLHELTLHAQTAPPPSTSRSAQRAGAPCLPAPWFNQLPLDCIIFRRACCMAPERTLTAADAAGMLGGVRPSTGDAVPASTYAAAPAADVGKCAGAVATGEVPSVATTAAAAAKTLR